MKPECTVEIGELRVLIRGALSLFENEGSDILHILHKQESKYHARTFGHIGAALFLSNDLLEEILEHPQEKEKV